MVLSDTPAENSIIQSAPPTILRGFGDPVSTRQLIFDNVLKAVQTSPIVENKNYRLSLQDVDYADADDYTLEDQKQAILRGKTLGRRLRGAWTLEDKATGKVIERKVSTIARVPYLTSRGTFIHNGNEYTLNNQLRLRPSVFTRIKDNGEIEAHANIMPGKGISHRYFLDPAKGIFHTKIGQAKIPLLPLLRTLGATDKELQKAWGPDLFVANYQKDDPTAVKKYYEKLVRDRNPADDGETIKAKIIAAIEQMELDDDVTNRTLGKPYKRLNKDALLDITKKLLAVSKGEAEPDDRDHLANQTVMGPEDLFAERIEKDAGNVRAGLLWKATARKNLGHIGAGALTGQIEQALLGSGLGLNIEEINNLDILDKQSRLTRLGAGGIPSLEAVPDESRSVQPSHLGFVDPLRSPESGRVGVDLNFAHQTRKGSDGRIYSPFIDAKTGEEVWKSPQELTDMAIAFPGEMSRPTKRVAAMQGGKIKFVRKNKIDLIVPHFENAFSPLANLVPMKATVKGQRVAMGSKMMTQALPLQGAEAPLVQPGIPGQPDRSYHEEYGKYMGAVFAEQDGEVLAVSPTEMKVKYADGTVKKHDLYNNFAYNRKTMVHNKPLVQPGQRFVAGTPLAKSNYTDDAGRVAIGTNLYTAYIPFQGKNFEDAVVISESAAKSKLVSQHMYQHGLPIVEQQKLGKRPFLAVFPSKFDKATLDTLDDDGVITPGSTVEYGKPLIVAIKRKESAQNKIHRKHEPGFIDQSVLWEHKNPGVVTDVVKDKKGITVLVKSYAPTEIGDKLAGLYGDKGVIADIIPDEQMPKDAQGRPFELLLNPLGIISRTNPSQIMEAVLGKIAKKTGVPYKIPDFEIDNLNEFVEQELNKHGVSDTDDVIDPETDSKLRVPVLNEKGEVVSYRAPLTGYRYFMKLHHLAESKLQGRSTGGYTSADEPAKGGGATSAKRISLLDSNALLSHGALNVLRDAGSVRGQRNEQYWLAFMKGLTPPKPSVPTVYKKFISELQAAGINVVPEGTKLNVMALTDKDVDALAEDRNLESADTVRLDKNMAPVRGGLFDPVLTGSHGGNRWSAIKLQEPLPNPVMEEPIRRMLGLTEKQFLDVIAGKHKLPDGSTGPAGLKNALSKINLTKEIAIARAQIAGSKKTARDTAIRKLGYLLDAQRLGIEPKDWMLSRVPVLPPAFRPISLMGDSQLPLVSDPNYLYKELMDANANWRDLSDKVEDLSEERVNTYNAFKAVTGLGEPTHPKLVEKNVKGILKHIFGTSPKFGTVQRRLISSTVDLVGRGTITPDPDLDMDHVGLPEEEAWTLYKNFIVRRLRRRGMPIVDAVKHVTTRTPLAKGAMLEEMEDRPVIINRAPVLHRFGIMAFFPKLTRGDTMRISPLIVKGFGADFDGDAMQFHVPVDEEAKKEAIERMLPSRNLLSPADFKTPVHGPTNEYVGGLFAATAGKNKRHPHIVRNPKDVFKAWKLNQLDINDPVVVYGV